LPLTARGTAHDLAGEGRRGRIVSASVIARDVTQRKHYEERLRHLAEHDPLTDVLNRRRFEEQLLDELARAQRYGSCGAVPCLDIDNFKTVNDSAATPREMPLRRAASRNAAPARATEAAC